MKARRDKLCLNFAKKSEKHPKFKNWYKSADYKRNTRQEKWKYCRVQAKHTRFEKSPLSMLTKILNLYHEKK